ncbi:hypothetical protein CR66_01105 [Campylobacter mucosalis]|uniref:hypothetical protein n=1 Tax=Campylobacter mucosalis TaxID=202 RepID=UPI0004D54AD0|nr:hypothetical protein [Campylobacter mucosalis]KEA46480.1 hypothetical protein CR66_01105 [Campylobacter mucosalis]QKF63030.1 hypothetical protein CMCT_0892 [Campylobacter mucosalis]
MRKILFFAIFVSAFGFDIDDLDKGMDALRKEDYKTAFEIFHIGCEADDALACEELGMMYVNNEVPSELDAREQKAKIGLEYFLKSCEKLEYMNACDDIVSLKGEFMPLFGTEIFNRASKKYDELLREFKSDTNTSE